MLLTNYGTVNSQTRTDYVRIRKEISVGILASPILNQITYYKYIKEVVARTTLTATYATCSFFLKSVAGLMSIVNVVDRTFTPGEYINPDQTMVVPGIPSTVESTSLRSETPQSNNQTAAVPGIPSTVESTSLRSETPQSTSETQSIPGIPTTDATATLL